MHFALQECVGICSQSYTPSHGSRTHDRTIIIYDLKTRARFSYKPALAFIRVRI
jgi:hypothetical protein